MSWWRRLRARFGRGTEKREHAVAELRSRLARLPFWSALSSAEQDKLARDAQELDAAWSFEGCSGLELTRDMREKIVGQAALLVLGLEARALARVPTVLVYPSAFSNPLPRHHPGGVVSEGTALLGEAWPRGPVVLAWDEVQAALEDAESGRNLVWHEFAHQLDLSDGTADGRPPLEGRVVQRRWYEVLKPAYDALRAADERGQATVLDGYGATNPAEFFAVATEAFFGRPLDLERAQPELYRVLADFYAQDPARRTRVQNRGERI